MEQEDRDGEIVERWSVSVTRYIEPHRHKGLAMRGQPLAQNYFHRPLSALLRVFFNAGFVVDALEEPVFPEDTPERNRFGTPKDTALEVIRFQPACGINGGVRPTTMVHRPRIRILSNLPSRT